MLEFSHFPYLLDEVNVSNAPHPATNSLRSKRFRASLARKLRREQRKGMTGYGEEREGNSVSSFPLPFPLPFCFFDPTLTFVHSLNWKRLLRRLLYQQWNPPVLWACTVHWRVAEEGWAGDYSLAKTNYLVASTLWAHQPVLSKISQRVIDIFIFSSQEDLFAKSTFFPSSIFTQKCGTDPVAHHHYPPKEVLPRKENPS